MVLENYEIDAWLTVYKVDPDTGHVHPHPEHQLINETAYLDLREELLVVEHDPDEPVAIVQYAPAENRFYITETQGWHDIIMLVNDIPVMKGQAFPLGNPSRIDIEIVAPARNKYAKFYHITMYWRKETFLEKIRHTLVAAR